MLQSYQVLGQIKKKSWSNRENYLAKDHQRKFLNSYSLYATLQEPKDWNEIAQKCSVNPNHEHFGKSAEDILLIWNTKKEVKGKEGNTLDDYITLVLKDSNPETSSNFKNVCIKNDEMSLVAKTNSFDKLNDNLLKKLTYIDSEIWLTSDVGINLRCDSLFTIHDEEKRKTHAVIAEWKSLDNLSTSNYFNKLIGPLAGYDDCDAVKFTLQTHLYKFILERYDLFDNVMTMLYNFNTLAYQKIEPAFPYNEDLILDIIAHGHKMSNKKDN